MAPHLCYLSALMLRRLGSFVAALAVTFLSGCGDRDHRTPLVVYSAHGRDILFHFEQEFERAHPDIDVQTIYSGPPAILERVRGEKTNPQAAVWWGADATTLDVAAREGLLAPYRPSYATEELPKDPGDLWTGCFQLPIVLAYNPDKVKPEELPRTIADLGDPRFKDRLILREPSQSGVLRAFFAAIIATSARSPGGEDEGFARVRAIHRNVRKFVGSPELMFEELEGGAPSITVWNLTDIVFQKQQKGYHFVAAPFSDPTPVIVDGIALIKGKGETAEAKAFYEFVNTPEALAYLAKDHARIPLRPGFDRALLLPEIRQLPVTPLVIDRAFIAEHMKDWMARIEKESRGGAAK